MVFPISECDIERNGTVQKCLKVVVTDSETSGVCIFNIPVTLAGSIASAIESYLQQNVSVDRVAAVDHLEK